MKSFIGIFLLVCSLSVFGDEIVHADVPRVETIYGLRVGVNKIQIKVESNGCTSRNSFIVRIYSDRTDNLARLTFIRVRPDMCRAFLPQGVTVEFSKAELGLVDQTGIRVDNPFGPNH